VQNLFKEYSGRQVLKDVSFTVKECEIFVLVGPNGAGKTTLLRILDLLEEPTSGRVFFNGQPIDYSAREKVAFRRKIGMVFQQTVLFNMSVFDNIAYPLKVRGEDERKIRRRVKEALELVQLDGFEHKNALVLSGGESQRVAIAQALVAEPELLLLDEPTANLDPMNVSIVEETLSHVNKEKKTTIIMTTHNMFQVENLAHRISVLNDGKIELIGTFLEIFGGSSEFVKRFARMDNVFHGFSRITAEGTSVIDIGEGLHIEAAFKKEGNIMLYVPPEKIIISTYPLSSAINTFKGRIMQILEMGHFIKLKVKVASDKTFSIRITESLFKEMQLNIGLEVFIAFKASSVQTN
jgi:tungstate transport system ATP-binding protein